MTANELYRAGKIRPAIDAQIELVKANPADQSKRLFLFELLVFAGDLEGARQEIAAVQYAEMELESSLQAYRNLLEAEKLRRRVFREGIKPQFLAPPPPHVDKRLEAVVQLKNGNLAAAAQLLAEADTLAVPIAGTLDQKPFTGLRDADDVFGPVLEVMVQSAYYWVPFEQIDTLSASAPKFARDLIWFPAKLTTHSGSEGEVFLPALYPGSHEHPEDQVRLGRMTDWKAPEGGPVQGVGLRVFIVGDDPVNLPDLRELQISRQHNTP